MIRLKTTSSSSCGPLNMSACVCVLPSCVRVWLLSCFLLSRKIRLSSAEAAVVLRLFFFQKIFPWFQFSFFFFFLVFLFIYDEEKRPFGEHKISGSIWDRDLLQLDSMVVSRCLESLNIKEERRGGKKKLLAAPVSRYLLLSFSFSNI